MLFNTSDLPRRKPFLMVTLPASLSARSLPFIPACPGQYTHRSFRRWMSTIDTFQSGLPIPLFTFCSKLFVASEQFRCWSYKGPFSSFLGRTNTVRESALQAESGRRKIPCRSLLGSRTRFSLALGFSVGQSATQAIPCQTDPGSCPLRVGFLFSTCRLQTLSL